ncbi:MAG: zinc ribbon domain-containing protein [Lachnospiraceae bacterium]|nr:zinc ribbon domain-containing protein [Lachnospiraceae bacterium]
MKGVLVSWIIILILILVIIGAVGFMILWIKRKIRDVSRAAFGTDSFLEGAEKAKIAYAETPKSVAGMTNLLLPKIVSDFPDFAYDQMKQRAVNVLLSYLRAVDTCNPGALKDANPQLTDQVENYIAGLKGSGRREYFKEAKVHRTEITQYRKADGRCIVTFQTSIQYYHYIMDGNGDITEGTKDLLTQSRYDIDMIYIQDVNKVENEFDYAIGVNCPNCGAPLRALGSKKCEYCGSPIIEINIHAWSFAEIRERK